MKKHICLMMGLVSLGFLSGVTRAASIYLVPVGNPGNTADFGYGSVGYVYAIGKFEVTAGQYTEFLNRVAATDTYGLYNGNMPSFCGIQQSGSSGSFTYTVGTDWAIRPVNYVSWGDAARFVNWLANGQPTGAQGLSTTEDGSYYLNGATSESALMAVVRKSDATWVIPDKDEWHKAAYHMNDGVTGNYWGYPTQSNTKPNNGNPEGDTGNSANYFDGNYSDSAYGTTPVGYFSKSPSSYSTFDQGGNVMEWIETASSALAARGMRGGYFYGDFYDLQPNAYITGPTNEIDFLGFRVANVPEPGNIVQLFCCAMAGLICWSFRRTALSWARTAQAGGK